MRKPNLIVFMLTALWVMPVYADEQVAISGDIGVFSQYVARGLTYTAGKPVVQGDLVVSYGGLSVSTWFSNAYASPAPQYAGRDVVEFDWSLDYSGAAGAFNYAIGTTYYTYLYDSASNYPEAYLGLSYAAAITPTLVTYVAFADAHNKAVLAGDIWADFTLSVDAAGLTLSAGASYAHWVKDTVNRPNADVFKSGLSVASASISKHMKVGDLILTASLKGTMPIIADSADGNKYIYGLPAKNEVVFGLNLAY